MRWQSSRWFSIWPCDRLEASADTRRSIASLDRTGFGIDFHADVLGIYDSSLDRLRITSRREDAEYRGPGTSLLFTSFFELTAGVDELFVCDVASMSKA